jgi:hypothetical protein
MAYQRQLATPVQEFPQFVFALAKIDTLDSGGAANTVDDRVGALGSLGCPDDGA